MYLYTKLICYSTYDKIDMQPCSHAGILIKVVSHKVKLLSSF